MKRLWWLVLDWRDNHVIQRRMRRNGLVIPDPWQVRVREAASLVFVCSWRGHRRTPGFDGGMKPCRRCSR